MMPMSMPVAAELVKEVTDFNTKVAAGVEQLSTITDDEVEIASTPKDLIFSTDKVTLYRYRPLVEQQVATPVLIVYSLIGRHTMTDLQEDRSLVRNLLKQGIDSVNQTQQSASGLVAAFEKGTPGVELPQVMLEMQKASVSFRALTEVRNRLVNAYQEIMNMPI